MSVVKNGRCRFTEGPTIFRLSRSERAQVVKAFGSYLETIAEAKRQRRTVFYDVENIVGTKGFGIGSAGLRAYDILIEGPDQALENDVMLSMKQANVPAFSRFVDTSEIDAYFHNECQHTVTSQPSLQAHRDPFLGWTAITCPR